MRHRGELLAALAAMGFGSAYVATAFALQSFQPVPAAAWRSVVALAAVAVALALERARTRSRRARTVGPPPGDTAIANAPAWPAGAEPAGAGPGPAEPSLAARAARLLVLAALAGPVFLASMNLAVAGVGATIAAFVAGLYAVLAAVIAPILLPERLTPRIVGGLVLALIGTALLAELDPAGSDVIGMAWGLAAAVSFAVYLVLARRWSTRYRLDGVHVALSANALSAIALGGLLLVADPKSLVPEAVSGASLLAVGWTAAVAALGPVLMVASLRLIPAARAAALLPLNPITATVLAALLLGERPAPLQLFGGLLVLVGMAVATSPAGMGGRILARVRA